MKLIISLAALMFIQTLCMAQGYRTNNTANHREKKSKTVHTDFGKNILSFSPLQVVAADIEESPDVALTASYERILDNELIGIKLPVSFSLNNNYIYFMPTLKLYPARQGVAKYAVGPQFLIGFGDGSYQERVYNPSTGITSAKTTEVSRKQFGFLINNSVNFSIAKSLYIGLDAGLGIIYYDNLPDDTYNYYGSSGLTPFDDNSNINPAFQIGFSMGFRF